LIGHETALHGLLVIISLFCVGLSA